MIRSTTQRGFFFFSTEAATVEEAPEAMMARCRFYGWSKKPKVPGMNHYLSTIYKWING